MQRVLQKALPQIDRRIDWRVDRKLEERVLPELPRQGEVLSTVSTDLTELGDQLLFQLAELRRWMIDDLEAANESTVLVGESLARLQVSVERLGEEVAALGRRLAGIEAALPNQRA